jgi:hypothetical protein
MARKISRTKAQEVVRSVVERHPRTKNAAEADGACAYKYGRKHCLVGRVLKELELPMPLQNAFFPETEVAQEFFTPAAAEYLGELQCLADSSRSKAEIAGAVYPDGYVEEGDNRAPWGRIPELAKAKKVRF